MKLIFTIIILLLFFFAKGQTAQMYLDAALVKMTEKNYIAGIDYCTKAIKLNDTLKQAYFYRAGFYVALITKKNATTDYKNYKLAITDYSTVLKLDKNNAKAFFYRAGAHSEIGFLDQAIKDYLTSAMITKNQPKVHNSLAVCYAKKGNLTEALIHINKAIEYDNYYAKAYANKGNILDILKNRREACFNWEKAIILGYQSNKNPYYTNCQ